jgi:tetratricopeptide (TPR) repeat protein
MTGALEGPAASEHAAASRVRAAGSFGPPALVGAAALVVGGALLRGGGSRPGPLFWIGSAAVLAAAVAATAVLAGALPRPALGRAGAALVGSMAAVAAWAGITVVWSIQPDRSWDSFNRAAAYVAVLVLGVLVGAAVRRAPRIAASLLAVLFALTIAAALLTVVVPSLGPDVERSARLRDPVEYWNALALVAAMALPVWLWLRRPLGAVACFATVVALVLTTSRGGFLVAVVAVAVWLAAVRPRREAAWLLLVSVPPGLAVGGWALTTAVAEAGSEGDTRAGALLGAVLAVVGAGVFALARRPAPSWALRGAGVLAAAGLVAAIAFAAPRLNDAWNEFRNPPAVQLTNDPSRLGDLSSNHRWTWWTQAWTIFREHPVGGTGAGTYALARQPIRKDTLGPIDPHDLGLKALSDTGIVGFLLLLGAAVAAAAVAAGAIRRTRGDERAAVAALAAGGAAWLAHSLVDMPWEYAAATMPALFGLGVLVTAGRPGRLRAPSSWSVAAVPLAIGVALLGSLAFPWLADRRLDSSLDALERSDPVAAIEAARDAHTLDPLSVEPLVLEGTAFEVMRRLDQAQAAYERAVRLQPQNAEVWYQLGRFFFESRCNLPRALVYADRSWHLDPLSQDTGRLLEAVRAAIAEGGCPR